MTDVFISYSRRNTEFARKLIDRLILKGKDAWVDWEGIPLTSPNWWTEIQTGIEAADSFVYIMSPDSMASVVCNMELDYALELGKRILPVIYQEVDSKDAFASIADFDADAAMKERLKGKDPLSMARENWQQLSHINWVFFRDTDNFDEAFDSLVGAIETDLSYVKAHTRYLTRATEWIRRNKDNDLLMFGDEIDRAEEWLAKADRFKAEQESGQKQAVINPLAQPEQRTYIEDSRAADRRRKRLARSAQLSIAALAVMLVAGLVIASLIVSNTQAEADNIQATSDQNVANADAQVAAANAELTSVPPTLTQVGAQVVEAQGRADEAGTQVADANDALTAVPPTLTLIGAQVVEAQEEAAAAGTQVADANDSLTAVPPTLTEVGQQVVVAQAAADTAGTQVADANDSLTAVPPTLTEVGQQVVVAQAAADTAGTQVADANDSLTAVPPTLTQVGAQIIEAQDQAAVAFTEVADANQEVVAVNTQVANANATLTPIPPTLTQAAVLRAEAEEVRDISQRYSSIISDPNLNTAQVLDRLNELVAAYPENPLVYDARGYIALQLEEYDQALADYTIALELAPSPYFYNERANVHGAAGDFESSIADYTRAIELLPDEAVYYFNRGFDYQQLGNTQNALEDYDRAIELAPEVADYYIGRGTLRVTLNDLEGAIADAEQTIQLDPNDAEGYYLRGGAYYMLSLVGNEERVLQDFLRAQELEYNLEDFALEFVESGGVIPEDAQLTAQAFEGEISPGETTGNLEPGEEQNWRYTAEVGQYFTVQIEAEFDAVLFVNTPTREEVGFADNEGPAAVEIIDNVYVPANGVYTIAVGGFEDTDSGPYTITLTLTDGPPIEPETLQVGENTGTTEAGERGYWAYEAAQGEVISLTSGASFFHSITVVDPSGDLLAHTIENSELGGGSTSALLPRIEFVEADTYLIFVNGTNTDEFGNYTLTLDVLE